MRRILLAEMAPHVHSFLPRENKVEKISKWMIAWIVFAVQSKVAEPYDLLPSKGEMACHIGVSLGTMQNVFRFVEDAGYIESKQRIGSYIKDRSEDRIEKLTSKKDLATDVIKKYLKENDYKSGDILISTRKLSQITGIPSTTLRVAIGELIIQGIIEKKGNNFVLTGRSYKVNDVQAQTLVEKVAERLKKYIQKEFKAGDRIPSSAYLTRRFNASEKTIHNAIKELSKEGLLYTRRGKYGTIVLDTEAEQVAELYNYEKIEQKIRHEISQNCQIGDKIPSIKTLASMYKTSEKTVKKALDNLASEGFLMFMRGRYGGTFVTDIPQNSEQAYTWLALNQAYKQSEEN